MPESGPNTPGSGESSPHPSGRSRKGHRRWVWGGIAFLILLMVGVFFLRRGREQKSRAAPAPAAVPVATEAARQGDIGIYVNALGSVAPVFTVQVKSRVDGQLMRVNYREGDLVREGDLLAEIDPRPFEALLTQGEGQLQRDKALLENALIDLQRYEIAYAKKAIPEQQLATQRATVHQQQGSVKFDQGQVDNAKVQLAYCRITAPISGRVGLRLVDPGNIVHATDTNPLVVITQVQPITMFFSVAQDYLPKMQQQLRQGHPLAVEAYDRERQAKLATGSVLALDNQIDVTTGTVRVRALFTNEDNALFPNQFVNARLRLETLHDAILVPAAAIQRNNQSNFLYVVQPERTVALRPVEVRATEGNVAAVEGLKLGEVIAANNFNRLQEGTKIIPQKAPAGTNTNQTAENAIGP